MKIIFSCNISEENIYLIFSKQIEIIWSSAFFFLAKNVYSLCKAS